MTIDCIKRKIYFIYPLMLMAVLMQGCASERFVKDQAEIMIGKGRPILEEYVGSLKEDAHIINVSMIYGCNRGEPSFNAKYPSHIVKADFLVGDKYYTAVVNTEDEKVYSNYDYIDPNEIIQGQLMSYLDEYEFNGTYAVSGAFYTYAFVSHQIEVKKGDIRDVYVYIDNIPDLAPVENADVFMKASISGFDITYEAENDEVFDPVILYEYLSDTGNYRKEDMRGDDREYHIKGGRQNLNFVNGEPVYYEISITSEGSPDTMTCDMMRWDYMEDENFCYLYVGGTKKESIKSIKGAEFKEYDCPFVLNDRELTYIRDDNNPFEGYLYVKNNKWNEIVMTHYALTNKSSGEKTNDLVDKWELESISSDELELVKGESSDLFELYIKGTNNKCEFIDDKVVILFK